jgi:hypothetical protein
MNHDERLRVKLIEDTGSNEEADWLLPVAHHLSAWAAPVPAAEETDRLVETLTAELPARRTARSWAMSWWLLRAQMRVVQQEIWLASALVMALGLFVTLAGQHDALLEGAPFVLIAPLVAALGIAFLYGPGAEPALEIERATPISPRLVVLTRLLLVFAFDLALALLSSVVLSFAQSDWSLWPLVLMWLAPMTFLAALAFLLSMIFSEPLIGAAICLALWGAQVLRAFLPFAILPSLMARDMQVWLWLSAAGCTGIALWLAGREERWSTKRA